jgi:hypothetical protein
MVWLDQARIRVRVLTQVGRPGMVRARGCIVGREEVGYTGVGGEEAEGPHHVLGRVREGRGPKEFVYFVIDFR